MNTFKSRLIKNSIFFISLFIIINFSACKKIKNENYHKLTYYDVVGTGYVYDDNKKYHGIYEPLRFCEIKVYSYLEPENYYSNLPIVEEYYTDESGFLIIKFPKATDKRKVSYSLIKKAYHYYYPAKYIEQITDTVKMDTLWINPYY
ncbi:MAG: hypothetical protein LBV69_11585 [Bacteroidales bacterium]|jgi:hypothetical protein|nr:hypothetical protein [Bacteroidales bacterium]